MKLQGDAGTGQDGYKTTTRLVRTGRCRNYAKKLQRNAGKAQDGYKIAARMLGKVKQER